MTTQVQFRRGTTSQHSSFTGAVGEVTVDTDLNTLKVHDGSAAGGVRIAKFTDIASSITAATIDISDSSSNTVSLVPGASDITFIGNDITTSAAGNTMTFTLNRSISVDEISAQDSSVVTINNPLNVNQIQSTDSTGVQINDTLNVNEISSTDSAFVNINDGLNVNGNIQTTSGTVTAAGFTIGSAAINEAELETIDGVTAGTVAASKAVVVDSDKDASGFRNVTATGSFIIGSADMNETDLEKLDGITNGTVAASKAVVVDANSDASGFRNVTATGSFIIGSADMNETDLEKLDGITNGTAAANKALVADANIDIGTIRNLSMTGNMDVGGDLQLDGNLTVSGTTNSVNTTTLEVADALLELNKNNSGGADIDGGILIQRGSAGNNAVFYWNEGDDKFKAVLSNSAGTATAVTDSSTATIVAAFEGDLTATTVTVNEILSSDSTFVNINDGLNVDGDIQTTSGSLVIGTASMNETDLEKLDGITNGTVAANKAVVVDGNKDASSFRNCTATTFIGALTGNADTATVLATSRNFSITGDVTGGAVGFTGAGNVAITASAVAATTVKTRSGDGTDAAHFITFVDSDDSAATGNTLFTDNGISYNPATNILTTTATAAQYSDLAEKYVADNPYEPGTVIIFGGENEVTTTEVSHDPRVAGVVSTAPGFIMNEACEGAHVVDLALTGRVPCKVKGVVAKGDLIVSSNIAGVGTKLNSASYQVGCIIGKALESKDTADVGVIEVVVGRL